MSVYVLLHGVMVMLCLGCTALDTGIFHSCPQGSCNSTNLINPCLVENNACKCPANNSSACGTLDQQTFVNLTGASNDSASQWTCCLCSLDTTYCCDKCNISTSGATAPPASVQPIRNFRMLLVFVLECDRFTSFRDNLTNSLEKGINNLTSIPLGQITVSNTSCGTGHQPYCGVDVESIRAHHRVRRLAVGGRMKGKTKSKNDKQFNSYNSYRIHTVKEKCNSLSANITVYGKNVTALEILLDLLRHLQLNNSLVIPLWDGSVIYSSFMLSAMDDASYSLHEAPTPTPRPPAATEGMPPIEVDLKPMMYAGVAIVGLITMCILWKFIKHSWLLSKKKFTPINSDRIDHKRDQQLKQLKIMEAMEENDRVTPNGSAFSTNSLPRNSDEANKQHPNWPSPGYPARSLVPAYKPTELHNQRSPPRLMLDEDGSDIEDRRSIDSASVLNLDDEGLSDILNSDDERILRPSNSSSPFSQGITNPAFIEESSSVYIEKINGNNSPGYNSKTGRKSKSPILVNGNAKLSVNTSGIQELRKGSNASSDLSLDAGENTVFLPAKNNKNQEKQKKGKTFLSTAVGEKNVRRSSITPLDEDKGIRKNSATDVKVTRKSLTVQAAEGGRRKSTPTVLDNERRVVTPKDTYTKGKKITKASTSENTAKSINNEDIDIGGSEGYGKNRTKGNGRSVTPVGTQRKSISSPVIAGEKEGSGRNATKINVRSTTPASERRKSEVPEAGVGESSGGSRIKVNELTTEPVSDHKNTTTADENKRKNKKRKAEKETKKKTVDSDDSSEDKTANSNSPQSIEAGLNVTSGIPDAQRRTSVALKDKESKTRKKKKRKEKEGKKRKSEDSETSSDEEEVKRKTKDFSSDTAVVPETKRRTSVIPDETQNKKKKQKEATAERRKSEIPEEAPTTQGRNGSFVRSTKKRDSLSTEKNRKKSIFIEDIESRSPVNEGETRRKSDIPEIPDDWKKPTSSSQSVARLQPTSISPIPTGYKSPRLIIKPSYHQY